MSLYADYLKERTNDLIIEDDFGFATYRYLSDNAVYIIDIYVKSSFRNRNIASSYANKICKEAKDKGCTSLMGTVNPSCKGATDSISVLIAYGMQVESSSNNVIIFRKEI